MIVASSSGLVCVGCDRSDELYRDDHGTFCYRCGPSVPVRYRDMSANRFRGHEIENRAGVYFFVESGDPVAETWKSLPCGHCGQHNTPEGHDACLGTIPDAINACCGHGVPAEAYIQFKDDTRISGAAALALVHYRQRGAFARPSKEESDADDQ